jgi:hypothetical protein
MKKIIFALSAIATLLVASCTQDQITELDTNDYVSVTLTLGTDHKLATRAIGDETFVNQVACAVYDAKGNELTNLKQVVPVNGDKATYATRLAKGHKYRLAFFAYNSEAEVYDVTELKNIKVNTSKLYSNDVRCDAFTAYYDVDADETMQSINERVTLNRPFAQLNFGIDNAEKNAAANAGIAVTKSQITVSNVYKAFSAYADEVVGEPSEMEFQMNDIPAEETFVVNGNTYYYLVMNYLLVDNTASENSLVDLEFTYEADGSMDNPVTNYYNVPVQRNYRTNVCGKLLTSSVNVEVDIEKAFDGEYFVAGNAEELKAGLETSGKILLTNDIEIEGRLYVEAGNEVYLDLNGKKISVDEEFGAEYLFYVKEGGSLTIDGNGTIEAATPASIIFCPVGNLVIENGTFIRNIPEGYTGTTSSMFAGTKPSGGWESTGVTIKGGYFDCGYYPAALDNVNVDKILAGEETLVETEDDIKKRGQSGDANVTRKALKNLAMAAFNRSNNYFHVYGGTFVGANPAWGDEGCMLPTTPQYLRPWSYYQGAFLDGQSFNENGIVLPEGYSITKGTHEDGRPIYTVNYSK